MPDLKLGKLPAREGAVKLKLADYAGALPEPPASFGWDYLVKPTAWGMLGNDTVGDCVIAGGLHETLLWRAAAKQTTSLSTACALKNYEAITGYNPNDPSSDQGTDMEAAAKYRRKTGLTDAHGTRHKIAAYVSCTPDEVPAALWLFGAVGMGIEFPAFAMDDFNAGKVWDVQRTNAKIEGGHYVPLTGRSADGNYRGVTWAAAIEITPRFTAKYADEWIVYLSTEQLTNGVNGTDLNGNKLAALQDDLKQLTGTSHLGEVVTA
jgi:hypothetical protein